MALLEILEYPDPLLRTKAQVVKTVDDAIRKLVSDMFETMYAAPGIGLAANQVKAFERVIVIDVSDHKDQPLCLINPELIASSGTQTCEEGCLSVPGVYADVERASEIQVKALDCDGQPFELDATELLAVCIQHEMDHLQGKLFVDYLSPLKRLRVRKKLEKQQRIEAIL